MRTRAAILHEFNKPLTIEEVEVAEPQVGEILVRILASGICHSDLSAYHGFWMSPLPIILGHEGAGIVDDLVPELLAEIVENG